MSETHVVTGAFGYTGKYIARLLLEAGDDVRTLTGHPDRPSPFSRPITESGWRVGGTWTVNRKTHPKIPNYEIMNIPRDPGISWAYDFGVGIAKSSGPATFGIDVVVEPIWSAMTVPRIVEKARRPNA